MGSTPAVLAVDPFDLPEWLGTCEVLWSALSSIHEGPVVTGRLAGGGETRACDLLAADHAFPRPVLAEEWRRKAHQSWLYEQVLLVEYDVRLTLAVPGTGFTADLVLEALTRLAGAVGSSPERFTAALRL